MARLIQPAPVSVEVHPSTSGAATRPAVSIDPIPTVLLVGESAERAAFREALKSLPGATSGRVLELDAPTPAPVIGAHVMDNRDGYAAATDPYNPGDIVLARDGRTQYRVQPDGSWRRLKEKPTLEDAVHARQRHVRDHKKVAAHKLEKRTGIVTPDDEASSSLILGADADREFKKLTNNPHGAK